MKVKVSSLKRTQRSTRRIAQQARARRVARTLARASRRNFVKAKKFAGIQAKKLAKRMAIVKARLAALKGKVKGRRVGRTIKDPRIPKRILAGRGGFTASSLKRKQRLGDLAHHHIVSYSHKKHAVVKYLNKRDPRVHINSPSNRILLPRGKVAGMKRTVHGKGYSANHRKYNAWIKKRLDQIQKLPKERWQKEYEGLQFRMRKAMRKGLISLD